MVVLQEPTQPAPALNRPIRPRRPAQMGGRDQQHVALPLVIAFPMIMLLILREGVPQGALPEQDQPGQTPP